MDRMDRTTISQLRRDRGNVALRLERLQLALDAGFDDGQVWLCKTWIRNADELLDLAAKLDAAEQRAHSHLRSVSALTAKLEAAEQEIKVLKSRESWRREKEPT